MEPTQFLTYDLALLGAAATFGVYSATARLTLLGWLVQNKDKLKDHKFVKNQIRCLGGFLFGSFVAAVLAFSIIGSRVHNWWQVEGLEKALFCWWAAYILGFLIFHAWIFFHRHGKKKTADSKSLTEQLVFIADKVESASKACKTVADQMEKVVEELQKIAKSSSVAPVLPAAPAKPTPPSDGG